LFPGIAKFLLGVTIALGPAQTPAGPTLADVLHHLDEQARSFHGLTADVDRTKVTVVVNDKSTESGHLTVHGDDMCIDIKTPDPRTILRRGDKLYIYNPKLQRVEEYDLGKHRELVDQFLLLGFGATGKSLEKAYEMKLAGRETTDGKQTVLLELTPKSKEVLNQIAKIDIWLDESSWLPVQQKFFEAGTQDYFIIRYKNVVKNPKIDDDVFKAHWPHGTERVHPQG
jgi:outer membrane lipoprotein-sorting protein